MAGPTRGSTRWVVAEQAKGGVALSAVLPGLPQILAGRLVSGGIALWLWLAGILLYLSRTTRISADFGESTPSGRAAILVLCAAGLAWAWSLRDVGESDARVTDADARSQGVWIRIARDPWAALGLFALVLIGWFAVAAPLLAPAEGVRSMLYEPFLPPSLTHPMGTDRVAADVYHRFLLGARATLGVGLFAGFGGAVIGILVGAVAGFFGGWLDRLLMRTVDFFIALPKLVLLIAVVGVLQPGPIVLGLFIALVQWPALARIVRADVAMLSEQEFVKALRVLGMPHWRILLRHVIPNAQSTLLVGVVLSVANAMLIEAGLGFLGLGLGGEAYEASWGVLIRDGADLGQHWWIGGFAGLALVAVVVSLNLVADAARDELDPRARMSA